MKKSYLLTFLFVFISLNVFAQDADQLNEKSKTLLDQGNYNQSFKTLSQAAELGHPEAQYNLGYSYLEGLGTSKNVEAANQWFLKSAKQDFVDAQFKLAYSYVLGRGVQKDMEKAFTWFSKAAQNGDAESQLLLVGMYIEGNGVEKNIPEKFKPDFLRGFFDADGSIFKEKGKYYRVAFSGNLVVISYFKNLLEKFKIKNSFKQDKRDKYTIPHYFIRIYRKKDINKIMKIMYYKKTKHKLTRKYKRFLDFKEGYNE